MNNFEKINFNQEAPAESAKQHEQGKSSKNRVFYADSSGSIEEKESYDRLTSVNVSEEEKGRAEEENAGKVPPRFFRILQYRGFLQRKERETAEDIKSRKPKKIFLKSLKNKLFGGDSPEQTSQ